ncbi:MAG: VenA family class IV lanthipeptide [Actinomycetota bacterium]|nr:VenA family class IV lanthipeptide [Actinomycetota bacterium]
MFELDVTELQSLPETDPVRDDGIQFGHCVVTKCNVIATKCNVVATK